MATALAHPVGAGILNEVVSLNSGLTSLATKYSFNAEPLDTLRLRIHQYKNLGSFNLKSFQARVLLIEPDTGFDANQAIHFSNTLFQMDSVKAKVVIRNLSFKAETSTAKFLSGTGDNDNGSLTLDNVQLIADSLPKKFITWQGSNTDTVLIRNSVILSPLANIDDELIFSRMGRIEINHTLIRSPLRILAEAYVAVEIASNTLVGAAFDLVALPKNSASTLLKFQNNHFIKNNQTVSEPILIAYPFGAFDPVDQRFNFLAGYTGWANSENQQIFVGIGSTNGPFASDAGIPASSETWLWRIPGDTQRGAFAPGGLPAWNVRPGETSRTFDLDSTKDKGIVLTFDAAEVPRVLGLAYSIQTNQYPANLAYRSRYRSDTALVITGPVTASKIQFADAKPTNYSPALLSGSQFSQVDLGAASPSVSQLTYSLPTQLSGNFLPALKTTPIVPKGTKVTWSETGSTAIAITLDTVLRAGRITTSGEPATGFTTAYRLLTQEGSNATALVLNGDVETSPGSRATLVIQLKADSKPFDTSRVQLWRKGSGAGFDSLVACHLDAKGDLYYKCTFPLTKAGMAVPPFGDITGSYALVEWLTVPRTNMVFDLRDTAASALAKLSITAYKGFQLKWKWYDLSEPSVDSGFLGEYSKRLNLDWPGREKDSLAKVALIWSGLDADHDLYALNTSSNTATLLPSQRNGTDLTATLDIATRDVFAARKFAKPGDKDFAFTSGNISFKKLHVPKPSNPKIEIVAKTAAAWKKLETDSLIREKRPLIAAWILHIDSQKVATGYTAQYTPPSGDTTTIEKALWLATAKDSSLMDTVIRSGNGNAWAVNNGPAFRGSMQLVLLGAKPIPPPVDTVKIPPIDTSTPPIDTVAVDTTKPDTVSVGHPKKDTAALSIGKGDSIAVTQENLLVLKPGIPKDIFESVAAIVITHLQIDPLKGPVMGESDTLKPGKTDTLRSDGKLDLGYSVGYLDSAKNVIKTLDPMTLPQPLSLVMDEVNADLKAKPLRKQGWHLLGWSLPDSSRNQALATWLNTSDEKYQDTAAKTHQVELQTASAGGKWEKWSGAKVTKGMGLLAAASTEWRPQFPQTMQVVAKADTLFLKDGWNLIANPFPFPMSEGSMQFDAAKLDQFQALSADTADVNDPWSTESVLYPFKGYAVYAEGDQNVVFNPLQAPNSPQALAKAATQSASHLAEFKGGAVSTLRVNIQDQGGKLRGLSVTSASRGAGYLGSFQSKSLQAWFSQDRLFSQVPGLNPEASEVEMGITMPRAGRVNVTVTCEGPCAESQGKTWSALLWDKQSGQTLALEKTGSLNLPAGTWQYTLITGSPEKLARQSSLVQGKGLLRFTLAPIASSGLGEGLWRLGIPSEWGYAQIGLTATEITGQVRWRRNLATPGAGWHNVVLPEVTASTLIRLEVRMSNQRYVQVFRSAGGLRR